MTAEVVIVDSGGANLASLQHALERLGVATRVSDDPEAIAGAPRVLVPGVGSAQNAMQRLRDRKLDTLLPTLRQPVLGICLGMQLLFDGSDEGAGTGLGVVPGRVTRLHATHLPQIGWNAIEDAADPMFAASGLVTAYYANSFACRPLDPDAVTAWSTHERDRFAAAVRLGDCLGVQFHPEKSSRPGLRFLDHFLENL